MSLELSIVIAVHNERPFDLHQTVQSIRDTTREHFVEIIIVDDNSTVPVCCLPVRIIRNQHRKGVGQSRHIGVEAALAPFVLLTDGHMIFTEGWLGPTIKALSETPKLLVCGQCLSLTEDQTDTNHPFGVYNGARMVIHDPEAEIRWRVLTAKWAKEKPGASYPLSAVMGACYAIRKDFFLNIGGLRMLREFGGDEELLSIKTLMAGGEIRLLKALRVGHKFRKVAKIPYRITVESCLYNTMMIANTCCPPEVAKDLIAKIGPGRESMDAKEMVRVNRGEIEAEASRLSRVFTRSWDDYLKLIAQIDG